MKKEIKYPANLKKNNKNVKSENFFLSALGETEENMEKAYEEKNKKR